MNVTDDILSLRIKQNFPHLGDLLIAEPFMNDDYFARSAVLMLRLSGGNVTGIVLNNKTRYTLQEVVNGIETETPIPLYCGGPVGLDRLLILHTLGDVLKGSEHLFGDYYINGDMRIIKSYVNAGEPIEGKIRFFVGYSGWSVAQLFGELRRHSWAVLKNADCGSLLHGCGNEFWLDKVRLLGEIYRPWTICPLDPKMN